MHTKEDLRFSHIPVFFLSRTESETMRCDDAICQMMRRAAEQEVPGAEVCSLQGFHVFLHGYIRLLAWLGSSFATASIAGSDRPSRGRFDDKGRGERPQASF